MPRISKRQALGWINFTRPPNENCNDKKALFRLVFSNVATATALVCLYLASSGPRDNLQAFEENSIFGTSLRGTETSEYVLPKYQNHDWEGIPAEEPGHPLVAKGYVDFIDNAGSLFLEDYLEEFLTVYENRPDKVNLCGMRINHSYALFLAIKALQPASIIENGVNAGHSTYIMRAASPDVKIYAIDPLVEPICGQKQRWMDTVKSEYFTGDAFLDFTEIDWKSKIQSGEIDPQTTMVLLDDHQDPSTRYPTILKYGFRHILFEDNYKYGKGATRQDKAGWLPKQLFHLDNKESRFYFQITKRYAEFPPLVPPVVSSQSSFPYQGKGGFMHVSDDPKTLVAPLLRPDLSPQDKTKYEYICQRLGLDPTLADEESYFQIMCYNQFAYMEMSPLADRFMEKWPTAPCSQSQK